MNKPNRIIRIAVCASALAVFCLWLRKLAQPLCAGTVFALLSVLLFAAALSAALCRLYGCLSRGEPELPLQPVPDTGRERLAAWGLLLLFGAAVTLAEFAAVYLLSHTDLDFADSFRELYYRSDVAHYMGIAEDWYVTEGDERLRLVFLPLYALAVRLFTWNGDYFIGSFVTAQVFCLCCLPAAYELFRLDEDRSRAMACARILYLLPGCAFLRVPMSEGLFLFLTLLAVYCARKKRFLPAALFTALAAFTRSLGVLLLGLLAVEMLLTFLETWRSSKADALRLLPGYAGALLLGCCGTLAYLFINWRISGSPFTFLIYQRENWTQELGLFFNTAAYQSEYALLYLQGGDLEAVFSLSLPNLICCFGTLGLLCADRKGMRISYLLWALVYFALSVGATWLLSGPRYLAMLFPLALALRRLCRTPIADALLEAALLAAQTAYLLMLALDMYVY